MINFPPRALNFLQVGIHGRHDGSDPRRGRGHIAIEVERSPVPVRILEDQILEEIRGQANWRWPSSLRGPA
jgi:hypothetical protein